MAWWHAVLKCHLSFSDAACFAFSDFAAFFSSPPCCCSALSPPVCGCSFCGAWLPPAGAASGGLAVKLRLMPMKQASCKAPQDSSVAARRHGRRVVGEAQSEGEVVGQRVGGWGRSCQGSRRSSRLTISSASCPQYSPHKHTSSHPNSLCGGVFNVWTPQNIAALQYTCVDTREQRALGQAVCTYTSQARHNHASAPGPA